MSEFTVKPLGFGTWSAFERLAERHSGAGFGCWCTWFHREIHPATGAQSACTGPDGSSWCGTCPYGSAGVPAASSGPCGLSARAVKGQLVNEDRAHAALVFDGDVAVGWCQYGAPAELPGIHHRKDYLAGAGSLPDYRLTCLFVDRKYRRKGVAAVALQGALDLIGQAGGGVVEGYPQDTGGKKVSASFLYNGTRSLYEQAGFSYDRRKGVNHCVMTKTVTASTSGNGEPK